VEVVILAAGAGRRFGGVKQFASVAPDGATLLEITARDCRHAGCERAVIVTAPGLEDELRTLFAARPVPDLDIDIALQLPDDLPVPYTDVRHKPWGTAHAAWAARHAVTGPFLLFNADDYYGPNAPTALIAALAASTEQHAFALLGYPLGTTLSAAGTVSRAVCNVDQRGRLTSLREYPAIDGDGRVVTGPDVGSALPLDTPVSMNAWAFTPAVFPLLDTFLRDFQDTADLEQDECYLPAAIDAAAQAGEIEVWVATAPDRWCGITWPEDRDRVAQLLLERLEEQAAVSSAAEGFGLEVSKTAAFPFGKGLIHDTWRLDAAEGPHLLQRLNAEVFADPVLVAENTAAAACRVSDALHRLGDDDPRHRLTFLIDPEGRPWLRDPADTVWRAMVLIPDARPTDPTCPSEVHAAARALGRFPGLVAEGSGPALRKILPGFHDTPARLATLQTAADANSHDRLATCSVEVQRLIELAPLTDRLPPGSQPVRLVHNDAKLDNVLVDENRGEALCVVDLDTVMPGLAVHDFGDLVRSAITGRPEDEPDLQCITVDTAIFQHLAAGYLEGATGWLENNERSRLVDGALVITLEQAARFLMDYLSGDSYYPVDDPPSPPRHRRLNTTPATTATAPSKKPRPVRP